MARRPGSLAAIALSVAFHLGPSVAARAQSPAGSLEQDGVAARHYAQQHQAALAAARTHRPWVWEVRKGEMRFWLAGCLHLGADPDPLAFSAYLPYFQRAGAVYFEVMPGSWENPDIATLLGRRGFVPDRRQISSRLSAAGWAEVQKSLQNEPALLERIRPMEPWFAALTLSREGYRRAGLSRDAALEQFFEKKARGEGKPVGAMEKAGDQVFAMADTNAADQERNLLSALQNYRKGDFGTAAIRRAWRIGDEAQLRAALGCDQREASGDEMHQNLIGKRNQAWVRKIESIVASGRSALIIVGVEHLVAEPQSLPTLLRAAGMTVNRVGGGAR